MINDFLKKYQEELLTEKIQLKEDIDLLQAKIKEESKFLNLLEESNESYFKEFTPRDINAKNNKKAEEIRFYLNELNSQMEERQNKMVFYDERLSEIQNLLSLSMDNDKFSKESTYSEVSSESSNNDSLTIDSENIKTALLDIKNMILLDPYRAQIELDTIINSL